MRETWLKYVNRTRQSIRKEWCLRWAAWVEDKHMHGSFIPTTLGYGNPHAMLLSGPPTGRKSPSGPFEASIECAIERALIRYKQENPWPEYLMPIATFVTEYAEQGTQAAKAEDLRMSLATYKRKLELIHDYLDENVFNKAFKRLQGEVGDYVFEA